MTEAAMLTIIVVGQGGLFLLVALVLWQKLDALRIAFLRLRKQVGTKAEVEP
jgi:hypothetical protein